MGGSGMLAGDGALYDLLVVLHSLGIPSAHVVEAVDRETRLCGHRRHRAAALVYDTVLTSRNDETWDSDVKTGVRTRRKSELRHEGETDLA